MANLDYKLLSVDKNGPRPIVKQIGEWIANCIRSGALHPGDRLPAERELAERLGVARGTVKAAYRLLEEQGVIRTKQGSGSFVIRDEELSHKLRKDQATALLESAISSLTQLGLSHQEISRLFQACMSKDSGKGVQVAIIYDTPELLLDLKRQLAVLPGITVSVFILESVTETESPADLLQDYDLIIAPVSPGKDTVPPLEGLEEKIMKAAVAPSSETLIALSALSKDVRVGIICRSNTFLALVKDMLLSYGFSEQNIQSFFEMDYTTETYFPGGIDVLISFSDAHIFTNPDFAFRNEEFWAKGGRIIPFNHQFERGSLIYIEDRVKELQQKSGNE